jgi:WD40 repeat protein
MKRLVLLLIGAALLSGGIKGSAGEPKEQGTLKGHKDMILGVAFSPDGRTIASAGLDGTVKLWEVATRKERASFHVPSRVLSVAFSPDGRALATAGEDGMVRLWERATERATNGTSLKGPFFHNPFQIMNLCYGLPCRLKF